MVIKDLKVNPKMVTLAREARGLLQNELGDKINGSQGYISRIELGQAEISDQYLEAVAKILNFPISFFKQEGEILPPNLSYRKREKVAQKLITFIDAHINIYRLNIQTLLKATKQEEVELPSLDIVKYGSPEEVARQIRKLWKVPKGSIANLTELLEANGVFVHTFDFGTERVDGRSIFIEQKYPVVFVNKTLLGDRQRFTLAYELGHLVMHLQTAPSFERDISHEANLFAAEFLMPEKEIMPDFVDGVTISKLAELKRKWKVSMQALLYRASDLTIITDNQKRYLLEQFNKMQIRRREPPELDVQKEQPKLLRTVFTTYKTKQKLNLKELAHFFHLTEEDFLEWYS